MKKEFILNLGIFVFGLFVGLLLFSMFILFQGNPLDSNESLINALTHSFYFVTILALIIMGLLIYKDVKSRKISIKRKEGKAWRRRQKKRFINTSLLIKKWDIVKN